MAHSSAEAEYRSLATTTAELCWLRMLFCDLHIPLTQQPQLFSDNVSALALASNPVFHARTKHVEIDYHVVCEKVLLKDLVIHFVASEDQEADMFTKGLTSTRFIKFRDKLMGSEGHISFSLRGDVRISST